MSFIDPSNYQYQTLKTKISMEKENQKQSENTQNSDLNKTSRGSEKSQQYKSIEEGIKHYARLSAQNSWMEEDMRLEEEQANEIKKQKNKNKQY